MSNVINCVIRQVIEMVSQIYSVFSRAGVYLGEWVGREGVSSVFKYININTIKNVDITTIYQPNLTVRI